MTAQSSKVKSSLAASCDAPKSPPAADNASNGKGLQADSTNLKADGIAKHHIATSFSAAARTYDSMAAIQKDIGVKLLACSQHKQSPGCIADIGCGTGWLTGKLRLRFPKAYLLGLDLAAGMIDYASLHRSSVADGWWVADMEDLPLASGSVDLLFSNLAMQWLPDPLRWLLEAFRVLKPGGQLLCSTLLPGTLAELEACWAFADRENSSVLPNSHVNRFFPQEGLERAIRRTQFEGGVVSCQDIRYYHTVKDLMAELKGIGAHNVNSSRPQAFTSKGRIRAMMAHYERYRTAKGLPATYEVGLLSLTRPAGQAPGSRR